MQGRVVDVRCVGGTFSHLISNKPTRTLLKSRHRRGHHHRHTITHLLSKLHDDIEPVPAATLSSISSVDAIAAEAQWVSGMIRVWLDDEWTPLDIHKELGDATARIYGSLRQPNQPVEVGDVVLGIGQQLMVSFNFREAFIGPWDVANKVSEILMLREGCDVCCVNDQQKANLERYNAIVCQAATE